MIAARSRSIIVSNLPPDATWQSVTTLFSKAGSIDKVDPVYKSVSGKQVFVVDCRHENEAQKCVDRFEGYKSSTERISIRYNHYEKYAIPSVILTRVKALVDVCYTLHVSLLIPIEHSSIT